MGSESTALGPVVGTDWAVEPADEQRRKVRCARPQCKEDALEIEARTADIPAMDRTGSASPL